MLITSDQHFYHKKIIEYENRPFKDLEDMHKNLIRDWNSVVAKKEIVYILGDFSFGNKQMICEIVSQLKGRLHLILGNHESTRSYRWWQECGFEFVSKYPIIYEDIYIFSHRPLVNIGTGFFNVHGHMHSKLYTADSSHFNVSVDNVGYKPLDFRTVKKKLANGQTR